MSRPTALTACLCLTLVSGAALAQGAAAPKPGAQATSLQDALDKYKADKASGLAAVASRPQLTNGACIYSKRLRRLVCPGEPGYGAVVIEGGNVCGGSGRCGENEMPAPNARFEQVRPQIRDTLVRETQIPSQRR